MKSFRRGAFLVASTNSVQDGLEAIIVSYLRIIFQVDFIKFYSMLKHVEGNESTIEDMYQAMGELDALIAVASFRESLPYYSQPEFAEVNDREGASLKVEKLYHPLIGDPVANSIQMQKGVLITGSNASGKSTFLKTIAINTILAQTEAHLYCKALLWKFSEGAYFYGIAGQSVRWRELLYGRDSFSETNSGRV